MWGEEGVEVLVMGWRLLRLSWGDGGKTGRHSTNGESVCLSWDFVCDHRV